MKDWKQKRGSGGRSDRQRHWHEDRDEALDAAALTGAQEVSRKGFTSLFFPFISFSPENQLSSVVSEKQLGPVSTSQSGDSSHFSPNFHFGQFVLSSSLHFSHSDCENSNSPSDEFNDVFSGISVKQEVKSVRLIFRLCVLIQESDVCQ